MLGYDWLDYALQEGKVVLIKSDFEISVESVLHVWNTINLKKRIMFLSVFPKSMYAHYDNYRQISTSEESEILSLYFTYEFSNNFRVLSRQSCCGSFLNLVDAGLISLDEALLAWLH